MVSIDTFYYINVSKILSLKNRFTIFETQRNPKRIYCTPKIPLEFFSEPETQSVSQFIFGHLYLKTNEVGTKKPCFLSIFDFHCINVSEMQSLKNRFKIFDTQRNPILLFESYLLIKRVRRNSAPA